MIDEQAFFRKYGAIIGEEVNVKKISSFVSDKPLVKTFKPLGSQLSSKFWKDTGQIIANGKQGNIKELEDGKIEVFSSQWGSWILELDDYEVVYEGLTDPNIAVDWSMIAKLDLEITPELEREGIARELSRFLNQMRKDADFAVEDKVKMVFSTSSDNLKKIIYEFSEFLKWEALLLSIEEKGCEGEIVSEFVSLWEKMNIWLSR